MLPPPGADGWAAPLDPRELERVVSEESLNRLGDGLLSDGQAVQAVKILGWRVELHPRSPNAPDSLAEAQEAAGDAKAALAASEKALALLEQASGLSAERKKALRDVLTARIARLR